MENIAKENLRKWTETLLTKDPALMTEFYSRVKLSFLPTLDPRHITNIEDAEDYFKNHFLPKSPKCVDVSEEKVDKLSDTCYSHSGLYSFEVGPDDKRTVAEARFTYIWKLQEDVWKIIHHHSSVLPL